MHRFWSTQPVSQRRKDQRRPGIINLNCPLRPHPLTLPKDYCWVELTTDDLPDLVTFINQHYVEDASHRFRFRYTNEMIRALCFDPTTSTSTSSSRQYRLGVRYGESKRLCAFILGTVHTVVVDDDNEYQMLFVDFLTIHTNLRNKRLAPVVIQELTRRANNDGIILAYYSATIQPSVPVVSCPFYIYPLNYSRLVDVGFWSKPDGSRLKTLATLHEKVPNLINGWHRCSQTDSLATILTNYARKHHLFRVLTSDDVQRWLAAGFRLYESNLGFLGYNVLENVVLARSSESLREVFLLYLVPATNDSIDILLGQLLAMARQEQADAVVVMEQSQLTDRDLTSMKFKRVSCDAHWFLYNYHHAALRPNEMFLPTP